MAYRDPNAPASPAQMRWVHGLWKTANERGIINNIHDQVEAVYGISRHAPHVENMLVNGAGLATMHQAGSYISVMLEAMPDKKPDPSKPKRVYKTPTAASPTVTEPVKVPPDLATGSEIPDQRPPTSYVGTPLADVAGTVDEVLASVAKAAHVIVVFDVDADNEVTHEQAEGLGELVKMLCSKVSLPVSVADVIVASKRP